MSKANFQLDKWKLIVLPAVCDDNWNYRLIISNENTTFAGFI